MKFLTDFFPILLFFVAYHLYDIYIATAVAIVAAFFQVGFLYVRKQTIEPMHWITLVILVVFGGATLILQDEQFIKWKPSVVNWLFGVVFLGSHFIGKKPLVQRLMEANIAMPAPVWTRLNLMWVVFFMVIGAINVYVFTHYDTDTWVNFKLFGMLGITLVFVVIQALYLARHVQQAETSTTDSESPQTKKEI